MNFMRTIYIYMLVNKTSSESLEDKLSEKHECFNLSISEFQVRGYPTIKIFRAGHKNEDPIDYASGRDLSSIVNTAMEYYVENIDPPTVSLCMRMY